MEEFIMQPKAVTSPIKKCRVGTKKNKNKQLKIMQKLIKLFQLVMAGSALICTLTLSIVNFQPTILQFLVSVLINSLVGAVVWLSYKELRNEDQGQR